MWVGPEILPLCQDPRDALLMFLSPAMSSKEPGKSWNQSQSQLAVQENRVQNDANLPGLLSGLSSGKSPGMGTGIEKANIRCWLLSLSKLVVEDF